MQTNPASTTQAKYTGIRNRLVFESNFSVMDGQTNYLYQPGTPADAIRMRRQHAVDGRSSRAAREEHQPNSRTSSTTSFTYGKSGSAASTCSRPACSGAGCTTSRSYDGARRSLRRVYNNGAPTQVREWNTPANPKNVAKVTGFFVQDAWTVASRLTLNLGDALRHVHRHAAGSVEPGRPVHRGAQRVRRAKPINQNIAVWRAGASYDLTGNGRTALKASYSRYGLQVGIDRVTNVNPLSAGNADLPVDRSERRRQVPGVARSTARRAPAFSGGVSTFYDPNGVDWPYSDEVTAGVETQMPRRGARRRDVLLPHQPRSVRPAQHRRADQRLHAVHRHRAERPGRHGRQPEADDGDGLQPRSRRCRARRTTSATTTPTSTPTTRASSSRRSKRFSKKWQMVAGFTIGKNTGGAPSPAGFTNANDLNDPNVTLYPNGIIGNDSEVAFRLSGSYELPRRHQPRRLADLEQRLSVSCRPTR